MPLIIASRAALRIALFPDNIISPDCSFNDHNLLTKLLKILTLETLHLGLKCPYSIIDGVGHSFLLVSYLSELPFKG